MVIPTIDKEQALTPNNLQFQPGLSLSEFLRDYGTQAQCEAALEKARWPAGYLCPACQSGSHGIVWHGRVKTRSILTTPNKVISPEEQEIALADFSDAFLICSKILES